MEEANDVSIYSEETLNTSAYSGINRLDALNQSRADASMGKEASPCKDLEQSGVQSELMISSCLIEEVKETTAGKANYAKMLAFQ